MYIQRAAPKPRHRAYCYHCFLAGCGCGCVYGRGCGGGCGWPDWLAAWLLAFAAPTAPSLNAPLTLPMVLPQLPVVSSSSSSEKLSDSHRRPRPYPRGDLPNSSLILSLLSALQIDEEYFHFHNNDDKGEKEEVIKIGETFSGETLSKIHIVLGDLGNLSEKCLSQFSFLPFYKIE